MEKCHEILMCISILWLAYETIHGIYAMKVTLISCIFPGGDLTSYMHGNSHRHFMGYFSGSESIIFSVHFLCWVFFSNLVLQG